MTIPLLLAAGEVAASSGLIALLIWLLVLAVIIFVVFKILQMIPMPEPIRTIVLCILGLVLLLVVIQRLGFL